jgi:hypothetical protein
MKATATITTTAPSAATGIVAGLDAMTARERFCDGRQYRPARTVDAPGAYERQRAESAVSLCRSKCAWHWGAAKQFAANARDARVRASQSLGAVRDAWLSSRRYNREIARSHLGTLATWRKQEAEARNHLAGC